jgi:hypothetical protein
MIKEDKVGKTCRTHGCRETPNYFGKPEGKRPLARFGRRRGIHIKIVLEEYGGSMWTGFI